MNTNWNICRIADWTCDCDVIGWSLQYGQCYSYAHMMKIFTENVRTMKRTDYAITLGFRQFNLMW